MFTKIGMEHAQLLNTLNELLEKNDFAGAKLLVKKNFMSLDEDTKGKLLVAIYASALNEINAKKQLLALQKAGIESLDVLEIMKDDDLIPFGTDTSE